MSERPSIAMREGGWLVAAWAVSVVLWLMPGFTRPDGAGYLQYLPSMLGAGPDGSRPGDLAFHDEWTKAGLVDAEGRVLHERIQPNGMLGNHWTVGAAVAWLPGALAGHAIAPRAEPFALTRVLPAVLGSALAGLLTMLLCWHLARLVAPDTARLAALGIYFGSPLLFYSLRNGVTAHALGALSGALVLCTAVRLRDQMDARRALACGLAAGFAFIVRPQNAPLALTAWLVLDSSRWREGLRLVPAAAAGAVVAVLPQVIVSRAIYGTPWGFLTLGGGDAAAFAAFERVWIWEPMLSWYHGMLPWTPLLGLAIAGLFVLRRRDSGLFRAAAFAFLAQWAINACLERSFWGAYAFGQRRFDGCTVFLALGLAAFLSRLPAWLAAGSVMAGCAWTTLLALAAPRFDLNAYQPPAALLAAMRATLEAPATWLAPLCAVPEGARLRVALPSALAFAAVALVAWMLARLARRSAALAETTLVMLGMAWLLLASALLARAAAASPAALERHQRMIARSRAAGVDSGAVEFRLGLLRQELAWLEATGRAADAARTREDIAAIEARRSR